MNHFSGHIETYQFLTFWVEADGFSKVSPTSTETLDGSVNCDKGLWIIHNIDYEIVSEDTYFHLTSSGFKGSRGYYSVDADNLAYSQMSPELQEMADDTGMTITELLQGTCFTTGSMTVSASDGSSVLLDPATGDSATVSISLSNPEDPKQALNVRFQCGGKAIARNGI